jgi:hypothetical protein
MSCAGGGGKVAARFLAKLRQALDVSRRSHNHANPSSHFDAFPSPSTTTAHCCPRQFASSPRPVALLSCRQHCQPSAAAHRRVVIGPHWSIQRLHWTTSSRHERCCAHRNCPHRVAASIATRHAASRTPTSGLAAHDALQVLLPEQQCALCARYHPYRTTALTSRRRADITLQQQSRLHG